MLILAIIMLLGISKDGYGRSTGELPGINQPEMMIADGESIFVLEGVKVHVFCEKTLSPRYTFGKQGGGPGEMNADMRNRLLIRFVGDNIFLSNWHKGIFYTKKGQMVRELRFPFMVNQIVPAGNRWVLSRFIPGENGVNAMNVILYDSAFKKVKTLYKKVDIHYRRSRKLDAPNQMIFIEVSGNQIFVADQKVDSEIMIFNLDGEKTGSIKLLDKPLKLTEGFKKEVYQWFEDGWSGRFKLMAEQMGLSRAQMREMIAFSEYFPTFRNMMLKDDRIYVEMFTKQGTRSRFQIFDLNGKKMGDVFLTDNEPGRIKMLPKFGYTFSNNSYLYIRENVEGETWELVREKI